MNIFALGIEIFTVQRLREAGYSVIQVSMLPDSESLGENILLFSSSAVPFHQVPDIRKKFPKARLIFHERSKGLRTYAHIHALCLQHDVTFLPAQATPEMVLDALRSLTDEQRDIVFPKVVGFFATGAGVGCTSVAFKFAKAAAALAATAGGTLKCLFLGLNLFDPSWREGRPPTSLDLWRPRISGRVLQQSDFEALPVVSGVRVLPGTFDILAPEEWKEEEIEYLLEASSDFADIVICDFGAIPQSAAYYVGLQRSAIKYLVTRQQHDYRAQQLGKILELLGVSMNEFFLIVNRVDVQHAVTPKSLSQQLGIPLAAEIPVYEKVLDDLPLGKKEQTAMEEQVQSVFAALGFQTQQKKGGLFRFAGS